MLSPTKIASEEPIESLSTELLEQVFNGVREGVVVLDAQRRVLRANPALGEMLGLSPESLVGLPLAEFSDPHDEAGFDTEQWEQAWEAVGAVDSWAGESWYRSQDGDWRPLWIDLRAERNEAGEVTHYLGLVTNVTRLREAQTRLNYLSNFDLLTGLPNRNLLRDRLEQAVARCRRDQEQLALLFVDLDNFKYVNDTLGHQVGDLALVQAARRLQGCIEEHHTVARMGGDEFVILMDELSGVDAAAKVAQRVVSALAHPLQVKGHDLYATASIGVGVFPDDGASGDELMRNAEAALFKAKERGRNHYRFFTEDLNADAFRRLMIESALRHAIKRDELRLVFQPQLDLETGLVSRVEALVRWSHPELGSVGPARFIPIAEEIGLIERITDWVLERTCALIAEWTAQGEHEIGVAINISSRDVHREDLVGRVQRALDTHGVDPARLEIELTEGALPERADIAADNLRQLQDLGVSIAVDDFGTGYSSLDRLRTMPINKLKLDGVFLARVPADEQDSAIARAIIALGHTLGMVVGAECVESAEQMWFLRSAGCELAQGNLVSRPIPADALVPWLRAQRP